MGHEEQLPPSRLSGCCRFAQETFAGTHMWTAPVSQGLQREMTFWSIAVICPASHGDSSVKHILIAGDIADASRRFCVPKVAWLSKAKLPYL